ncbi:restriction endonuclease subunit S [Hyphomonas sp.]|uniref:restriction endonuclease subunit S n=1 Tax=Hyphomonas sp. TaxID=87 RepID=UPI0025C307E7|nr:restriction endonuclease subunit S [Hyphomonas sp.]
MRPGYKQTEVGEIPEDWSAERLGSIVDPEAPIRYGVVQIGKNVDDGVPIVPIKYMKKIASSPLHRSSKEIEGQYKGSRVIGGDVLVSVKGTIGRVGVVPQDFQGNIAREIARIRVLPFVDSNYVAFQIAHEQTQQRISQVIVGTTRLEFSIAAVRDFEIALPEEQAEQRAIAAVLLNVDETIIALERLVSKKRDLKQAAMQQLLTGETRLPGFSGEWRIEKLGDLADRCFSGATPRRNRPEFYKGPVRWITSGELNYNVIYETRETVSFDAVKETNLIIVPPGTFLMAVTGLEAEGTRGACAIVGAPSTMNQSCMAVFPNEKLITPYLFHYYVFRGNSLALQYCQGTKQQSYTAALVKQLPIKLPETIKEQAAIAAVLSDLDAELSLLESQLGKTQMIKQAMMQELLTGRIRLPIKEAVDA